MKRFHVHVVVDDLTKSVPFYSAVFAQEPTVRKDDYAKWLLDDPRLNFAISTRNVRTGINHLGLQAENAAELGELHGRLQQADREVVAEQGGSCCYSRSDKYWVTDPQGTAWETFHTLGEVPLYAGDSASGPACGSTADSGCCPSTTDADTTPREPAAVCCPAA
jgi:catechol 2,3-dioxygenase-like lactoylglutathione lyase family enzyme